MPFIKEDKIILPSITKFSTKQEITSEVEGYKHAQKGGIQTANLLHWSDSAITVEYINGISSFQYLHLLNKNQATNEITIILNLLLSDVIKFQEIEFKSHISFSPYAIKEKSEEILEVMARTSHPLTKMLSKKLSTIQKTFQRYATFPFRDANPKNTILKDVYQGNFLKIDETEITNSIRHIDFRSVSELTTKYDDIISTLYHYQIPTGIRSRALNIYNVDSKNEEFLVTLFIRFGRFWSRRNYYLLENPKLFHKRYNFENIEYYNLQFNNIVELILKEY